MRTPHLRSVSIVVTAAFVFAACGGDDTTTDGSTADGTTVDSTVGSGVDNTTADTNEPVTLTLLAHESFTPSEGIFDTFTEETGIRVEVVTGDDAGTLLAKASLTAGNPEGDVLWGVDNTLLSRAVDDEVFEPYTSPVLDGLPAETLALVPGHEATPVDTGDVCVNYDIDALADEGIEPPQTLDDLIAPEYKGKLVVASPASSSPGLAFLLATVAAYGEDGWQDYWKALRDNDVQVVDNWSDAYYGSFTRAGGDRPLVLSYASSPPAEIVFADPPLADGAPSPTGVATDTCFRQVEFAGVLRGTEHREEAGQLIDFLIGATFQSDLPLTQFVNPVNPDAVVPDVYADNVATPDASLSLDPSSIEENRSDWIDAWTTIVLR